MGQEPNRFGPICIDSFLTISKAAAPRLSPPATPTCTAGQCRLLEQQQAIKLMPQSEFWPFMRDRPIEQDDVDFSGQALLLQKQLGDMEGEVKEIQMELAAIRRSRHDDTSPRRNAVDRVMETDSLVKDTKKFEDTIHKLHEKKKSKDDIELSRLREELIRAKSTADEEKLQRLKYEGKLKDLELKINDICSAGKAFDSKESRKVSEEVVSLKSQVRDMKEETADLRMNLDEKTEQLQEYRVKYLQAQQQVEEMKRQLDVMEFDNKQASDQIQIELQKMKMQFQEKLLELAPLPDLLKGAQIQLQEAKQLQRLAEDSALQTSNELHRVKEKLVIAVNNLNQEKNENSRLLESNHSQKNDIDAKQREIEELSKEIDDYKCKILRFEEKLSQQEARYNEKTIEYAHLVNDLEQLKEESNRTLNRAKDRSESTRHYLQTQIAGLERQMIACRAQCRAYQKERDEIRQRMQIQIHSLKENFELVEARLRGLQGQVALLKHCYSVTLPGDLEENIDQEYADT